MEKCDICGKNIGIWSTCVLDLGDVNISCCNECSSAMNKARKGDKRAMEYLTSFGSKYRDYFIKKFETPEQKKKREAQEEEEKLVITEKYRKMIVTTGDIKCNYDVIRPVYFQVSNKGVFGSALDELIKQYDRELFTLRSQGQMSGNRADWGFLWGEWSAGQNDFDKAFFIATEELKKRAARIGADAIVGMRQDIDIDSNGFQYFYLQMYGTAVKFKEKE